MVKEVSIFYKDKQGTRCIYCISVKCAACDANLTLIHYSLYYSSEPFVLGGQPDDDRIFVSSRTERAPDYTEGEQE